MVLKSFGHLRALQEQRRTPRLEQVSKNQLYIVGSYPDVQHVIRPFLVHVYSVHDERKVENVIPLLRKYQGKEIELVQKVVQKYSIKQNNVPQKLQKYTRDVKRRKKSQTRGNQATSPQFSDWRSKATYWSAPKRLKEIRNMSPTTSDLDDSLPFGNIKTEEERLLRIELIRLINQCFQDQTKKIQSLKSQITNLKMCHTNEVSQLLNRIKSLEKRMADSEFPLPNARPFSLSVTIDEDIEQSDSEHTREKQQTEDETSQKSILLGRSIWTPTTDDEEEKVAEIGHQWNPIPAHPEEDIDVEEISSQDDDLDDKPSSSPSFLQQTTNPVIKEVQTPDEDSLPSAIIEDKPAHAACKCIIM